MVEEERGKGRKILLRSGSGRGSRDMEWAEEGEGVEEWTPQDTPRVTPPPEPQSVPRGDQGKGAGGTRKRRGGEEVERERDESVEGKRRSIEEGTKGKGRGKGKDGGTTDAPRGGSTTHTYQPTSEEEDYVPPTCAPRSPPTKGKTYPVDAPPAGRSPSPPLMGPPRSLKTQRPPTGRSTECGTREGTLRRREEQMREQDEMLQRMGKQLERFARDYKAAIDRIQSIRENWRREEEAAEIVGGALGHSTTAPPAPSRPTFLSLLPYTTNTEGEETRGERSGQEEGNIRRRKRKKKGKKDSGRTNPALALPPAMPQRPSIQRATAAAKGGTAQKRKEGPKEKERGKETEK